MYVNNNFNDRSKMKVVIEKLYDKELNLELYNTVLLFVTDIEIMN